ncbi:hypothetical protein CROQUDRAFT_668701 [Cronartium quercuum f. sp. fusiforme G11]|uniref:Uncharacterized protein n=1 Tax=Cronartium quercuum f. sp. fusiforme G11 TaxID=708437 RepID=A0A9P6NN47_9BASI|nr:hypothetical protein CROQUDRAFT_668701 [Cronartium quercuum f. sp. fusiforme G11]
MPVYFSSVASAPPYQTNFSPLSPCPTNSLSPARDSICLKLYTPSNLATMESVIVESDEESDEMSNDSTRELGNTDLGSISPSSPSTSLLRSTSNPSLSHSSSSSSLSPPALKLQFDRSSFSTSSSPCRFSLGSNPQSPSSPADTRSRAMENLTEALERRRAKENLNPLQPQIVLGGSMKPKRANKNALGLRAAVGSYKKRCPLVSQNQTGSEPCTPTSSDNSPPDPLSPTKSQMLMTQTSHESPQPASNSIEPLKHLTNSAVSAPPLSPRLNHSQYLAARRESIMQRVGGHRRVVSETKAYVAELASLRPPAPAVGALPSLDQIRSWAAHRKHAQSDKPELWVDYSMATKDAEPSTRASPSGRKSKSLPIFAHARDPSIPRICLSPDSDDDDAEEDDIHSEPPLSTLPTIMRSPPKSAVNNVLDQGREAVDLARVLLERESDKRAEQRQALLANLALARLRRSANASPTTTTPGFQIVAPV